jgi:hypothetical protein
LSAHLALRLFQLPAIDRTTAPPNLFQNSIFLEPTTPKTLSKQNAENFNRTTILHRPCFPLLLSQQPNGFELTCGAVSMRARFAHEIEILLTENCTSELLTVSATERVHAAPPG